jgi:hypothetical protein
MSSLDVKTLSIRLEFLGGDPRNAQAADQEPAVGEA